VPLSDSWPKEVLLDWQVIQSSPLMRFDNQRLCFSGGSVVDVVFEQVCLKQTEF
jgi:hypothetical protein